jgi:hypothetical protein
MLVFLLDDIASDGGEEGGLARQGARIVMLWPEEGHVFRTGKRIIAAIIVSNFNVPHAGYLELLLNGRPAANFTPEQADDVGNRRLHIVLPDLSDGTFSAEVQCKSLNGTRLATAGATFQVLARAHATPPPRRVPPAARTPAARASQAGPSPAPR